jgi:catechol 2,3-dioxygenase-like lactoylglutathione lyase family enzyme
MAKIISDSWVMAGVRDVKKSVAFYAKLGLKSAMQRPYYAELNLPGGTVLGLHRVERKRASQGKRARRMSDGGWGIMLRVRNIKRVVADLKRKRVRCGKIEAAPGGADFSSLHDPDGNRLVLLQM